MPKNDIQGILDSNKGKNFVDRIRNPKNQPRLKNSDGSYSTHSMASGESEGRGVAFPTVVQPTRSKKLVRLPLKDAFKYAMKTGEHIKFDSDKEADSFSKNYKSVWNK